MSLSEIIMKITQQVFTSHESNQRYTFTMSKSEKVSNFKLVELLHEL